MAQQSFKQSDVIRAAINDRLADVHTALWGTVQNYDPTIQAIDVQIIPRERYIDENDEVQTQPIALLSKVPVMFPGSGANAITFPIARGDVVLIVCLESSSDAWLQNGGTDVDPDDDRRFALNDAVAIPGLRSFSGSPGPLLPNAISENAVVVKADSISLGDANVTSSAAVNDDLQQLVTTLAGVTPGTGSGDAAIAALQAYLVSHPTFPGGAPRVKVR